MTLITLTTHNGTTRSCSARCHDAKGKRCNCICGGMLHGVGLESAISLMEDLDAVHIRGLFDQGRPCFHSVQLSLGLNTEGGQDTGDPSASGHPPRVLTQSLERRSRHG